MKNYLMYLSYDGSGFCGWQSQKNGFAVQECVENAIKKLAGESVQVTASGRTDEGVHALGQAVSFMCNTTIPAEKFADALNTLLPLSVRAYNCSEVSENFCARKSAKRKTYAYRWYLSPRVIPHADSYALRIEKPFDTFLMKKACALVEGTHDFKEFYCLGSSAKTTVRTVYECDFSEYAAEGIMPPFYEMRICGNGFLYKMVRLISGALGMLDSGKITLDDFAAALKGDSGRIRKVPAPGKGLTLVSVEYE